MSKTKTLRSAAKRFRMNASGKFKHKKANSRHLLTKKTTNRKRHLRVKQIISHSDKNRVRSFFS